MQIQASSTSTTITVSEPDSAEVGAVTHYYYTGNFTNGANIGYSETPTWSWSNFSPVGNDSTKTTISNLWPGRKLTFALAFQTSSATNIYLSLPSTGFSKGVNNSILLTSNSSDYVAATSTQVIMANAINIYAELIHDDSSLTNADVPNTSTHFSSDAFDYRTHGQSDYPLLEEEGKTALDYCRIFYTIEFSDSPDTLYTEYKELAGTNLMGNDTPAATRWFKQDGNNGTSNCYQNLAFSITELAVGAA